MGAQTSSFFQMRPPTYLFIVGISPLPPNTPIDQVPFFLPVQSHGTESSVIILPHRSYPPRNYFLTSLMSYCRTAQILASYAACVQSEG